MQKKSYSKVNDYIWGKVLKGELKLGDKLPPERDFSTVLGISRNSTREGIKILESLGVITSQQGAGNYISADFEDVLSSIMSYMYMLNEIEDKQITEFRCALELEVVNLITGKVPKCLQEELLENLEKLENHENDEEGVEADKRIHYLLFEASDNEFMRINYKALTKIMDIYIPRFREKIISGIKGDEELRRAHRMMVEGIIEGDRKKSLNGVTLHFRRLTDFHRDM